MKNSYDLVIIGAGPAGASAAYYSTKIKDGANVLLIESLDNNKFERYHHMCGEAVSKFIHNDFPEIDIRKFVKNEIKYFYEYWGKNLKITSKTKGYILDRPKFLKHLIEKFKKNNGEFLNDRVKLIKKINKNILLELNNEKISTKYLIISTGPNQPKNNIIKLEGELNRIPLYQITIEKFPLRQDTIKFYYDEKYKENYKWIFPYGKHVKIGVPLKNKEELKDYEKYKILRKDVKYINCGKLNNYNFGNTILIGDAAFQNNPLTKGGIRTSFNSAKIAVESIFLEKKVGLYDKRWKKSGFYNKPYISSCKLLKRMNNIKLEEHAKIFKYYPLTYPIALLKDKRYIQLFNSYISSEKYGW